MKTLKKIFLVSFLMGIMLTSVLITQGQNYVRDNKSCDCIAPYISAGPDVSFCNTSEFITQGINTFSGGTIVWKTDGDGVFQNVYSLITAYIPGKNDVEIGTVTLMLIYHRKGVLPQNPIVDEMVLHLENCSSDSDTE